MIKYGGNMDIGSKVALSAALGGTAEALGGGKFANGAVTGAYVMMFNHLMEQGQENKRNKNGMAGEWDWSKMNDNERAQVIVDNMKEWDFTNGDPTLNDFFYNLPVMEENVSITIDNATVNIDGQNIQVWIRGRSKTLIKSAAEVKGEYFGLHDHARDVGFGRIKYGIELWIDTYYKNTERLYYYINNPSPFLFEPEK
jgi:hypothetical protein